MKTLFFRISFLIGLGLSQGWAGNLPVSSLPLPAPVAPVVPTLPAPTDYAITARDAHSQIWQRTIYEQTPDGKTVPHLHSYTELATGLNYKNTLGQWVPSQEEITILPDGTAAAIQGQHKAYFPADIYNGQIKLVTPDGQVMQSQPSALSYDDGSNTVLIAVLTNSIGYLASSNQVIYPHAFVGVDADLRYTYTKAGFEQDIVLHSRPAYPDQFGLNPETTKMQVLTEFFAAPAPKIVKRALATLSAPAMDDEELSFGNMQMVPGKAFSLGQDTKRAPVGKNWVKLQGRQFLSEEVPTAELAEELESLPEADPQARLPQSRPMLAKQRILPPSHLAAAVPHNKSIQLAMVDKPGSGLVLDYNTVNASLTSYTFQGDTTYYISGTVNLYGTNTFEGGTVLKYASGVTIWANSAGSATKVNWLGSAYRPVVMTAKDDNTVGETVSGSTGNPSGYYAACALDFYQNTSPISNFRIAYAQKAISVNYGADIFYDGQLLNCQNGIENYSDGLKLRNLLFANVSTAFSTIVNGTINAQNVTFKSSDLGTHGSGVLTLTNCLLVNSYAYSPFVGGNNGGYNSPMYVSAQVTSSVYPFQTVGGGSYYLTNNSPFRNVGTTNIDSALLADLATKTTYSPIVYSNVTISASTSLSPQAQRDTDIPDLGYHYDPLDYIFGGSDLYTNLILTAGTAVGWFENLGGASSSGQPYGLSLNTGANLTANGTTTAPCWVVSHKTVQEGVNGNWNNRGWMAGIMFNGSGSSPLPQINNQFTKWSVLASSDSAFRDNWNYGGGAFKNCEFYVGNMGSYDLSFLNYSNCLFFRSFVYTFNYSQPVGTSCTIEDCTFYNGYLGLNRYAGQSQAVWVVHNTAFDGTGFSYTDNLSGNTNYTKFDYNAYNTNNLSWQTYPYPYPPNYGTLENAGVHDLKVSTFNWQSSWLGDYYLPTNSALINKGSTTADQVGLYHFTTQTNQTIEANSTVDIGYHYVAMGAYENLIDNDGNGIPDYQDDVNGNGIIDSGETAWYLPPVIIEQPQDQALPTGNVVMFQVRVNSLLPVVYQWKYQGAEIVGATNSTLVLNNVQTNMSGIYSVIINDANYSIISSNATLTVLVPPSIITQPVDQTVVQGGNVIFIVEVSSSSPSNYQWQKNGSNLPDGGNVAGANTSALNLSGLKPTDAGIYSVIVSNAAGYVTSTYAVLRVWSPLDILAWGYNIDGETNIPVTLTNAVAITAGDYHNLALRGDGVVTAWGLNNYGQTNVPVNLSNVVAVAAGANYNLALKNDGTVMGWGNNANGQTNIPANLSNVVAITSGGYHSLALRNDGSVMAWGLNNYGQTNVPSNLTDVIAIAAGSLHSLILKGDGTLTAWGYNGDGETNIPVGLSNVVAIAAGAYHNLALKSDGTVTAWGQNVYGQINIPAGLVNVVAIFAGSTFNFALKNDGTAVAWGQNTYGQTNIPAGLTNIVAFTGGFGHALAAGSFKPVIILQPQNQTINQGDNAVINIVAAGVGLNYQWYFNGAAISGANQTSLVLTDVQYVQGGNYSVIVTNRFGLVSSYNGVLNVIPAQFIPVPPNMIAWWPANGNAIDAVSGVAGMVNSGLSYTSGKIGQAFQFDGDSGGMATSVNGLTGNAPHTIETWLKINALPSNRAWILLLGADGANSHHWLLGSDGGTQLGVWNGAQAQPVLPLGVWIHLAMTFDGTTLCCYTNGVLQSMQPAAFDFGTVPTPLTLGLPHLWENGFNGLLDEVTIYNRALASNEIAAIYHASSAGKNNDSDANDLQDAWEIHYFGTNGVDPNADADGDGLSNLQEFELGTDPTKVDTDGDGRSDWQEYADATNPLNPANYATSKTRAFLSDQPPAVGAKNAHSTVHPNIVQPEPSLVILKDYPSAGKWSVKLGDEADPSLTYDIYIESSIFGPWSWAGNIKYGIPYLLVDTTIYNPNNQGYLDACPPGDSDGDSLSDYYELRVTKTNPNSSDSNNNGVADDLEDYNHGGMDNWNKWISPQVAGVYTTISQATRGGSYGVFTIHIPPQNIAGGVNVSFNVIETVPGSSTPLTATYVLKDSANNTVTTSLHFAAGQTSADIFVIANAASAGGQTRTVTMKLTGSTFGDPITPDSMNSSHSQSLTPTRPATVTILDNATPLGITAVNTHPTISVTSDSALAVKNPQATRSFHISRSQSGNSAVNSRSLRVNYHLGGTAIYQSGTTLVSGQNVDYTIKAPATTGSVVIPAGASSVDVTVIPLNDSWNNKPIESVILNIDPNRNYEVDTVKYSARILIDGNGNLTYTMEAVNPVTYMFPWAFPYSTDLGAYEIGQPARFLITRTGSTINLLSGSFQFNSTAVLNTDFFISAWSAESSSPLQGVPFPYPWSAGITPTPSPFSVGWNANSSRTYIDCYPIKAHENPVGKIIQLHCNTAGITPSDASIQILSGGDLASPSMWIPTSISVQNDVNYVELATIANGPTPAVKASFRFTRDPIVNGNYAPSLGNAFAYADVVLFRLAGQAKLGRDYTISSSGTITYYPNAVNPQYMNIVIPASSTYSPVITITPISCYTPSGVASVIVETLPGAGAVGINPVAALRIRQPSASATIIPDTDSDGVDDKTEIVNGTDPLSWAITNQLLVVQPQFSVPSAIEALSISEFGDSTFINIATVSGTYPVTPAVNGSFRFRRDQTVQSGQAAGTYPARTVYFQLTGQARLNTDYTISAIDTPGASGSGIITTYPNSGNPYMSITIPSYDVVHNLAGAQYSPTITVTPISCSTPSGVASIILKVLPGAGPVGVTPIAVLRILQPWASTGYLPDTDGDGIDDGTEIINGTDPLTFNSNVNGVFTGIPDVNSTKVNYGDGISGDWYFHPIVTDSDGDGYADFSEMYFGTDPTKTTTRVSGIGPTITLTKPTPTPPLVQ